MAGFTIPLLALSTAFAATSSAPTSSLPSPTEDSGAYGPKHELVLPLGKLSEDAADEAQEVLDDLHATYFACPGCGEPGSEGKKCPDCEEPFELTEDPTPIFGDVEIDTEEGLAWLEVNTDQLVTLARIEKAMKEVGVRIPRKDVPVLPWSRVALVVKKGALDPAGVREALKPYFAVAELEADPKDAKQATLLAGKLVAQVPPTLAALEKALQTAGVAVADLAWHGPCDACADADATLAGCARCWAQAMSEASYEEEDATDD